VESAESPLSQGRADHTLVLSGMALVADPTGALYWPDERLLVVADLHLEKGSSYAARGVLLPPYDTAATLARLAGVIGTPIGHSLSPAIFNAAFAATALDWVGGPQEARVLRSPRSGLRVVFRSANWTVYELPHATPLLTGPAHPVVTSFGHTVIRGRVFAAGHYLLRAHYNPYWRLQGAGCAAPGPDKMTILRLPRPERFALSVPGTPGGLARELFGDESAACESS